MCKDTCVTGLASILTFSDGNMISEFTGRGCDTSLQRKILIHAISGPREETEVRICECSKP